MSNSSNQTIVAALLMLGLLSCVRADAQTVMLRYAGDPMESAGGSIVGLPDLNGDGTPDFALGSPTAQPFGFVTFVSGTDGTALGTVTGTHLSARFGGALVRLGDVSGDGIDDFAIGEPGVGGGSGAFHIYNGAMGGLIRSHNAPIGANNSYGSYIAAAGDTDGDGRDDYMVSASGMVWIHSGAAGNVRLIKQGSGNQFGIGMSGIGDITGDGYDEFAIGEWGVNAPGINSAGSIRVYSGFNGAMMTEVFGEANSQRIGMGIGFLGDVDGDGTPDFYSVSQGNHGLVRVYSGASLTLLNQFQTTEDSTFSTPVAPIGDIDNDGIRDLAVGDYQDSSSDMFLGSVKAYSGASGALIFEREGLAQNDQMGRSVGAIEDVDGDGIPDIVATVLGPGQGVVISGQPLASASSEVLAGGCGAGLLGPVRMISTAPVLGQPFTLQGLGANPGAVGWIVLANEAAPLSVGPGCVLPLDPGSAILWQSITATPFGTWTIQLTLPQLPKAAGLSTIAVALFPSPSGPLLVSDFLRLNVGY